MQRLGQSTSTLANRLRALPGLPETLLQLRDSRVPETLALPTLASQYAVFSLQLVPKLSPVGKASHTEPDLVAD